MNMQGIINSAASFTTGIIRNPIITSGMSFTLGIMLCKYLTQTSRSHQSNIDTKDLADQKKIIPVTSDNANLLEQIQRERKVAADEMTLRTIKEAELTKEKQSFANEKGNLLRQIEQAASLLSHTKEQFAQQERQLKHLFAEEKRKSEAKDTELTQEKQSFANEKGNLLRQIEQATQQFSAQKKQLEAELAQNKYKSLQESQQLQKDLDSKWLQVKNQGKTIEELQGKILELQRKTEGSSAGEAGQSQGTSIQKKIASLLSTEILEIKTTSTPTLVAILATDECKLSVKKQRMTLQEERPYYLEKDYIFVNDKQLMSIDIAIFILIEMKANNHFICRYYQKLNPSEFFWSFC
jgi:hypothetical protein